MTLALRQALFSFRKTGAVQENGKNARHRLLQLAKGNAGTRAKRKSPGDTKPAGPKKINALIS